MAKRRPQAVRGKGVQVHKCSLCHATGHLAETCTSPAAEIVRRLHKQIKELQKQGGRKKNRRIGCCKDSDYSSKARLKYSGCAKQRKARP